MNQRNINIYTKFILKLNPCLMLSAWICCYAHTEKEQNPELQHNSHVLSRMDKEHVWLFLGSYIKRFEDLPPHYSLMVRSKMPFTLCSTDRTWTLSMFPVEGGHPHCHGRVPPDDKQESWVEFNVCSSPEAGQINTGLQLQELTFRQTASFQATQWPFLFGRIALLGVIVYTVSTLIRDT